MGPSAPSPQPSCHKVGGGRGVRGASTHAQRAEHRSPAEFSHPVTQLGGSGGRTRTTARVQAFSKRAGLLTLRRLLLLQTTKSLPLVQTLITKSSV